MNIGDNTKRITLIGKPLGQSFAARMQNAAYAAMGADLHYFNTEAGSERLGELVAGIRSGNYAGFAVTKPNKVAILPFLDELDPLCRKMGAANTVVKTPEGRLIGYNTDGIGFYTSLTEEGGVDVQTTDFFCVGAGGAGRAICCVLAHYGAKRVYITDREEACAKALTEEINRNFAPVAQFVPRGDWENLPSCGVVINASGVGMGESIGYSPIPKESLRPGQLCFDACYNPEKTKFLLDGEELGCRVLNGLGMSLYQGAAQIELWTGCRAPVEAMRRELLDIIAGR